MIPEDCLNMSFKYVLSVSSIKIVYLYNHSYNVSSELENPPIIVIHLCQKYCRIKTLLKMRGPQIWICLLKQVSPKQRGYAPDCDAKRSLVYIPFVCCCYIRTFVKNVLKTGNVAIFMQV